MIHLKELLNAIRLTDRDDLEDATDSDLQELECELFNLLGTVETHQKTRNPDYQTVLDDEVSKHAQR